MFLWTGNGRFTNALNHAEFTAGAAVESSASSYGRSDDRLKHNEVAITGALATIQQLRPQHYDMAQTLENADDTHREAGFIAQEVAQIPELAQFVIEGSDTEIWRLNYNSLFTYAVAAIQELATTIASLEARLAALEAPRRRSTARTAAATESAGVPAPPAPSPP